MTIFWIIYSLAMAAYTSFVSLQNASDKHWTVAIGFSVLTVLLSIACGMHVGNLIRDKFFKEEN